MSSIRRSSLLLQRQAHEGLGSLQVKCRWYIDPLLIFPAHFYEHERKGLANICRRSTNIVPFCRRGHVGSESCVDQRRAIGVCIIRNYPASSQNNSEYVVVKSVSQLPQLSVHNNYLTSSSWLYVCIRHECEVSCGLDKECCIIFLWDLYRCHVYIATMNT